MPQLLGVDPMSLIGPLPEPEGATDFEVMSAVLDHELNRHFHTEVEYAN
jgi:hypothetical protein